MFINAIPAGVLELFLFMVLLCAFVFVAVRVARRHTFLPDLSTASDLPSLQTDARATIKVRRLFRDYEEGNVLAEGFIGRVRLRFCLTDLGANRDAYRTAVGANITIAPYALARLESVDDMGRSDFYTLPADLSSGLELTYSGPHPNDYTLHGVVTEIRTDTLDEQSVFVYRFGHVGGLTLEAAVEVNEGKSAFKVDEAVIGTARLYGYLAPEAAKPKNPDAAKPRSPSANFRQ